MNETARRPDPDALLRHAERGGEGRLKIFLGAAPGVGKTYAMLTTARARHLEGVDVVAGVVETHGRAETEALLAGLEVLPRRAVAYKGHVLDEMDLDGLLLRRPQLALVDELAHTNAPESRHPKRWMDVMELLDAGIDVYTTLNVQHLESLNDVVAGITRIRVRETVPDRVVDRADAIELIDITPEDLQQRLREGKVYAPKAASRAIAHYFSPGNLTALRELALRQTAQRVDTQLLHHMQANAIAGPWAAGECVLVCITPQEAGANLVRYARRLAERLHAPWTVLHVETGQSLGQATLARIASQMRLAQSLGGKAATLPGRSIAAEALAYARANNVTQIVIARPCRSFWSVRRADSLDLLIREAGDIALHVVNGGAGDASAADPLPRQAFAIGPYLGSTGFVLASLGIALALRHFAAVSSVSLAFLAAVLAAAAAFGLWPALYACIAGTLAFNFFFLPPLYTFTVADPENVVALFFFLATAIVTSNLGARMRAQALIAQRRAAITDSLYQFSRKVAGVATLDDLLWATSYHVASLLNVSVVLLMPGDNGLQVRAGYPPEDRISEADRAAAVWAWEHDRPAGRGSDNLPGGRRLFLPMRTARGPVAVIGLDAEREGGLLTPEQQRLLDAVADQAAIAVERLNLMLDLDKARLQAETERLRGAVLTSISHDLRTPLASILGAATSLDSYGSLLDAGTQKEMLGTIRDEAERLNRFVANLLDMTRLEAGALSLRHEPADIGEIAGAAIARAAKVLERHRVRLEVESGLPLLNLDVVLLEQVVFNLLDNAAKYTPDGTEIGIRIDYADNTIRLAVQDEGPGIPPALAAHVFDKFTRLHASDRRRPGTGLGLAIARGFVEAMGGSITAAARPDRSGALFTIRLPVRAAAP